VLGSFDRDEWDALMSELPDRSPRRAIASLSDPSGDESLAFSVRAVSVGIGQGTRNEIVLEDDTVSTNHARLELVDGAWRLVDLDSRNGTYVEGVRIPPQTPTPLADGATVGFGAVRLAFHASAVALPESALEDTPQDTPTLPRAPEKRSAGFRLPVWLLLLVILVVAVLVFLVVSMGGDPGVTEPLPEVPTVLRDILEAHLAA
jgi:hypothetical protein